MLGGPWPAPGEPLFHPEDRDAIEAVATHRAEHCPNCNTRPQDWQLPVLDVTTGRQAVDAEGKPRWVMVPKQFEGVPRFCFGCKERKAVGDDLPADMREHAYIELARVKGRILDDVWVEAIERGYWIDEPA